MEDDWRISALGGGLVVVFMATMGVIPFVLVLVTGLAWATLFAALQIALLAFIDENGSGLRGQVLRPGRIAVLAALVLGFLTRMLLT